MASWQSYQQRIEAVGASKRQHALNLAVNRFTRKLPDNPAYKNVLINNKKQNIIIISEKTDKNIKTIHSMPGEHLEHGGIVDWMDNKWLITEVDADNELYMTGKMQQCNYPLRWIDNKGNIIEKWCIVEDGTKYLIGEKLSDIMAIGDARIAITIAKDEDTIKLSRGKRFLIDDLDSKEILAYQITKPNKLFNVYNGKGVFRFILNEVNSTDNDNRELRIADYYNWQDDTDYDNGKRVWI